MNQIWHVGYDGMAMPVIAASRSEAEEKVKKLLSTKGTKCNLILAREASMGYLEWIENFEIEVLQ